MAYPQFGGAAGLLNQRVHASAATVTALAAIPMEEVVDGMTCLVTADRSNWVYSSSSTATDSTSQLAVAMTTGAWLRADTYVDLKLTVAFGTADAAVLFTVPTGFILNVQRTFWEVTTPFTGGSSSAIGLSSSNAGYNTKGDLQGGASGDLTAALGAGYKPGTVGAKFGSNGVVILVATNTIRFDRIASVYTAGAGFAHVEVQLIN